MGLGTYCWHLCLYSDWHSRIVITWSQKQPFISTFGLSLLSVGYHVTYVFRVRHRLSVGSFEHWPVSRVTQKTTILHWNRLKESANWFCPFIKVWGIDMITVTASTHSSLNEGIISHKFKPHQVDASSTKPTQIDVPITLRKFGPNMLVLTSLRKSIPLSHCLVSGSNTSKP